MTRPKARLIDSVWRLGFAGLLVAVGVGMGVFAQRARTNGASTPDAVSALAEGEAEEEEGPHVHLSEPAFRNLGIEVAVLKRSDFAKSVSIPCEIVGQPGKSTLSIAAPTSGIVTRIHVVEGQSIRPTDPLFDLAVTDDKLTEAQIELLKSNAQLEVLAAEARRLAPITESGAVAGVRKLKLDYERQQLEAKRDLHLQELRLRGLSQEQVDQIVGQKELVREITVRLSSGVNKTTPESHLTVALTPGDEAVTPGDDAQEEYGIHDIAVHPGSSVKRGDKLSDVSFHSRLLVKAFAFEHDLTKISELRERGWSVKLELGHAGHEIVRDGLEVLYVASHVDEATQTFPCFLELKNEVVDASRDSQGRWFRTWRFKPGQRGHVVIPVRKLARQLVVGLDAVVKEGPETFVFREQPLPPDHGPDEFIEFAPVPVQIVEQSNGMAVIDDSGQLQEGDRIATNQAYKLNLAMKVQAGGGQEHHHHH